MQAMTRPEGENSRQRRLLKAALLNKSNIVLGSR